MRERWQSRKQGFVAPAVAAVARLRLRRREAQARMGCWQWQPVPKVAAVVVNNAIG